MNSCSFSISIYSKNVATLAASVVSHAQLAECEVETRDANFLKGKKKSSLPASC